MNINNKVLKFTRTLTAKRRVRTSDLRVMQADGLPLLCFAIYSFSSSLCCEGRVPNLRPPPGGYEPDPETSGLLYFAIYSFSSFLCCEGRVPNLRPPPTADMGGVELDSPLKPGRSTGYIVLALFFVAKGGSKPPLASSGYEPDPKPRDCSTSRYIVLALFFVAKEGSKPPPPPDDAASRRSSTSRYIILALPFVAGARSRNLRTLYFAIYNFSSSLLRREGVPNLNPPPGRYEARSRDLRTGLLWGKIVALFLCCEGGGHPTTAAPRRIWADPSLGTALLRDVMFRKFTL